MPTLLGITFSTDEKVAMQIDLKLIGSTVESLVIEFVDQEKFEQLLSSGSVSPKSMRKYRKVLNETRYLASSEASQGKAFSKANRMPFSKEHGSTSLEVHTTSLEFNMACNKVSNETCKSYVAAQGQDNDRDYSRQQASLEATQNRVNRLRNWKNSMSSNQDLTAHFHTEQPQFVGVRNNSYEPSEVLILGEDVKLAVSKQKLRVVQQALNTTVKLFSQDATLPFRRRRQGDLRK